MGCKGRLALERCISEQTTQIEKLLETHASLLDDRTFCSSLNTIYSNVQQVIIGLLSARCALELNLNPGDGPHGNSICQQVLAVKDQMEVIWVKLQLPVLDYFAEWGSTFEFNPTSKRVCRSQRVERRKMLARLRKVFKDIHRFYYRVLEHIVCDFDTSPIIAPYFLNALNLVRHSTNMPVKYHLSLNDTTTIAIVTIFYKCLLYLGSLHYQLVLLENQRANTCANSFAKATRYLIIATNLLPSYGSAYHQLANIEREVGNPKTYVYYLVRSITARIPAQYSRDALLSSLEQKVGDFPGNICTVDYMDRERHTAGELYDRYFLITLYYYLSWGEILEKTIFKMEDVSQLHEMTFKELVGVLEQDNTGTILYDVIILIGFFHKCFNHEQKHNRGLRLENLKPMHLKYLKFVSDYFVIILNNVSQRLASKPSRQSSFLDVVRVLGSWMKSNKCILQFFHRDRRFCNALAQLLSVILKRKGTNNASHLNHKPKRKYFFREDVILKDFPCIGYSLTDFDDSEILTRQDVLNRLLGSPPRDEKLDECVETELRLHAIACLSIKFLRGNSAGITLHFSENKCIRIRGMVSEFDF